MSDVVPVLRVAGSGRNVGKTWLARHLIEAFSRRGYAVGAIKRSHHPLPPDKPGSDTDLFMQAGAMSVVFGTAEGTLLRNPTPATSLAALVEPYAGIADLVIVDGSPLYNLRFLYAFGALRLDSNGRMIRTGGIVHTIKDGIVYDAQKLLAEVAAAVAAEKRTVPTTASQQ